MIWKLYMPIFVASAMCTRWYQTRHGSFFSLSFTSHWPWEYLTQSFKYKCPLKKDQKYVLYSSFPSFHLHRICEVLSQNYQTHGHALKVILVSLLVAWTMYIVMYSLELDTYKIDKIAHRRSVIHWLKRDKEV